MSHNAAALKSAALLLLADSAGRAAYYDATSGPESAGFMDAMEASAAMVRRAKSHGADHAECVDIMWAAWWEEQDSMGVPRTTRP